ncbi:MAG: hypothetical protein ACLGSA_14880 [Acidobacteriota bacterium]
MSILLMSIVRSISQPIRKWGDEFLSPFQQYVTEPLFDLFQASLAGTQIGIYLKGDADAFNLAIQFILGKRQDGRARIIQACFVNHHCRCWCIFRAAESASVRLPGRAVRFAGVHCN